MRIVKSVAIVGQGYDIYSVDGDVIDARKWSTTEVSGGGTNNVSVTSRTDIHDQFFLKLADGSELAVRLENANLALRAGHRLTMFAVHKAGETTGQYVAVKNHSTRNTDMLPRGIQKVTGLGNVAAVVAFGALVVGVGLTITAIAGRFSSPQAGFFETLLLLLVGVGVAWFGFRPMRAAIQRNKALQAAVGVAAQASA